MRSRAKVLIHQILNHPIGMSPPLAHFEAAPFLMTQTGITMVPSLLCSIFMPYVFGFLSSTLVFTVMSCTLFVATPPTTSRSASLQLMSPSSGMVAQKPSIVTKGSPMVGSWKVK